MVYLIEARGRIKCYSKICPRFKKFHINTNKINKYLKNLIFSLRLRINYIKQWANGKYLTYKGILCRYYLEPDFRATKTTDIRINENVVIQRRSVFSLGANARIYIGENSRIGSDAVIAAQKSIYIGSNVLIAARFFVTDHNHNFSDKNLPIINQGPAEPHSVTIGDDCWIGINVAIMPGVTLGRGCVVGANSVVTKSFDDNAIIAGIPAKPIPC